MTFTIALAGNPNSGKTTLFNALTGSKQKVGNWPGVTIDKKEGSLKGFDDVKVQDLPGIYSLSPYTMEEIVSRKYLVEEKPDLIVDVVDGSNISRNLYLTSQLLELDIPVIIALNMMDVVEKNGDKIDIEKMSEVLSCPVVPIVASKKGGADNLIKEIDKARESIKKPKPIKNSPYLENALDKIGDVIGLSGGLRRYYEIKVFENDDQVISSLNLSNDQKEKVSKVRREAERKEDDFAEGIITTERYDAIEVLVDEFLTKAPEKESLTEKIDKIVTSRVLGLPIFLFVMWFVYYISISKVGTPLTDILNDQLEALNANIYAGLLSLGVNEVIVGIISGGALAGAFAVIGFLPQMLTLFFLLSILEDIGYMSRVAFVMDRVFRKFGLSGKSFIPLMIGTGCSVPGIQASRTIENDRDRRITIMTTSFMPCSAKLPVISLVAGAFFPEYRNIASYSLYVIGVISVIVSGVILKKFKSLSSKPAAFVMELPDYHMPSFPNIIKDVLEKGWAFVKRAGTVIAVSSIVLWVLANFDTSLNLIEANSQESILARLGGFIAPIFAPLGFGTWQAAVASFTGFIAKENIVSSLGVVLNVGSGLTEESTDLLLAFRSSLPGPIAGYSFLLFNMLCMPCFAAVGAIKSEMNSTKWTLATIGYLMGFAYAISFMFYNFALYFVHGIFDMGTIIALIVLVIFLYLLFRKNNYKEGKEVYEGYAVKDLR